MNAVSRLIALVALIVCAGAGAHDSRPLSVVISIADDGQVVLAWAIPPSVAANNRPELRLTECEALSAASGASQRALYHCADGATAALEIRYPLYNPALSSAVVVERDGEPAESVMLAPDINRWPIASTVQTGQFGGYFSTGLVHIAAGADHLLFVFLLTLIAASTPRLIAVVTTFTIAHSLSLALIALQWLRVSTAAVEVVIALSIVFLAAEIVRSRRDSLTWRYPFAVAFGFGLVHGCGFGSVLLDFGLPAQQQVIALLGFNLGIEAGQLAFVVLLVLGAALLKRLIAFRNPPESLRKSLLNVGATLAGLSASVWLWARIHSAIWSVS